MAQQLGKYEILDSLGVGATAEVFRARDTVLGREVALKVLKPALVSDPTAFARFAQEAQAAAQLFHPHIALVLDMGSAGDRYFIALQYVPGKPLDKVLAEDGPLPWAEVLRLAEHVGEALTFAHARGFLHRDVKPANIIRTPEGDYVLTDFGLTRAMMATGLTSHTGVALGTPAYIPPEIWLGEKATPAADEYALACVLVEALTGQVLFAGETPPAVMTRHVLKGAELPQTWPAGAPEGIGAALAQALQKSPADRHGGPGALVMALHKNVQQKWHEAGPMPSYTGPTEDVWISPIDDKTMVCVPAGEFLYGEEKKKEALPGFWIDKTPVTNAEYKRFLDANPKHPVPFVNAEWAQPYNWDREKQMFPPDKADHPVVLVSWHDATAYAEWAGKRLPGEKQWEKAARGTDGREYPWGNDGPDGYLCNYAGNEGGTTPIGAYSPQGDSPYECVDMAGNVWEWTMSEDSVDKVVRGGSWNDYERGVRTAYRLWFTSSYRGVLVGFRCIAVRQD